MTKSKQESQKSGCFPEIPARVCEIENQISLSLFSIGANTPRARVQVSQDFEGQQEWLKR